MPKANMTISEQRDQRCSGNETGDMSPKGDAAGDGIFIHGEKQILGEEESKDEKRW